MTPKTPCPFIPDHRHTNLADLWAALLIPLLG